MVSNLFFIWPLSIVLFLIFYCSSAIICWFFLISFLNWFSLFEIWMNFFSASSLSLLIFYLKLNEKIHILFELSFNSFNFKLKWLFIFFKGSFLTCDFIINVGLSGNLLLVSSQLNIEFFFVLWISMNASNKTFSSK